jgi:membrane protease YdiL (CAAX protease family)
MGSHPDQSSGSVPQRLFAARWSVLAFALFFPGVMAWAYFVVLARPVPGQTQPPPAAFSVYLASKIVQFGFPVLWLWRFEPQRLQWARPHLKGLVVGLAFGLFVATALLCVYFGVLRDGSLLAGTPAQVAAKVTLFHIDTPARYIALSLFIAGAHSLLEEYYWRWFVFGEVRRLMQIAPAIALSSLAFMLHHVVVLSVYLPERFFSAALPFSLCVAIGGAVWAWIYCRSGSIYSCWFSHLLVDAAILLIGYDMVFESSPVG